MVQASEAGEYNGSGGEANGGIVREKNPGRRVGGVLLLSFFAGSFAVS